jgi:hypothetical protein
VGTDDPYTNYPPLQISHQIGPYDKINWSLHQLAQVLEKEKGKKYNSLQALSSHKNN